MLLLGFSLLLLVTACPAQQRAEPNSAPVMSPEAAVREARALVRALLAEGPERDTTNTAVMTLRARDGQRQSFPLRVTARISPTNWMNIYQAWPDSSTTNAVTLTIVHTPDQPNEYSLKKSGSSPTAERLAGNQTMVPFAGSDFWVGDLGMEFLHWPEQHVLKYETRRSQSCDVLESVNPQPAPGAYSRVLCWFQHDPPHGLVEAEAYNSQGELLKQFEPKTLEKIHGQYEPEKLEIRNRQTGSRSILEFDLRDH